MTDAADPREHSRRVAAVFDLVAPGYDNAALRFFPFAADRLILELNPARGDKILDIATGTGVCALAAAQAVGPEGRVVAIDLAEAMLDRLERKIRQFGLGQIDLHVMDGAQLEFRDDYFHHAVCSFGLFFLPDMLAGLKEWARVTRPGGRVMFSAFGPQAFEPMKGLLFDRLERYGVDTAAALAAAHRLNDPGQCRELLSGAGLADIAVTTGQLGYHLQDAREWWEIVWYTGLRGFLQRLSPGRLEELKVAHMAEVAALASDQGIELNVPVHFASARKP